MKIKSSTNKKVTEAVRNCREIIVSETINLLKLIGAEQGEDVVFNKMLFLYQNKDNTVETIVCDRIAYAERHGSSGYYIVSMGKDEYVSPKSDLCLSLSNLQAIYDEVKKIVRNY